MLSLLLRRRSRSDFLRCRFLTEAFDAIDESVSSEDEEDEEEPEFEDEHEQFEPHEQLESELELESLDDEEPSDLRDERRRGDLLCLRFTGDVSGVEFISNSGFLNSVSFGAGGGGGGGGGSYSLQ